nr:hypothetical protein [Acetobacter persici]
MLKQRVQMVQQGSGVLVQEGATEPRRVGGPCRKALAGEKAGCGMAVLRSSRRRAWDEGV